MQLEKIFYKQINIFFFIEINKKYTMKIMEKKYLIESKHF